MYSPEEILRARTNALNHDVRHVLEGKGLPRPKKRGWGKKSALMDDDDDGGGAFEGLWGFDHNDDDDDDEEEEEEEEKTEGQVMIVASIDRSNGQHDDTTSLELGKDQTSGGGEGGVAVVGA